MARTFTFVVSKEKETTNTIRYLADPDSEDPVPSDAIYVKRWALSQMGSPEELKITIEPA
jgi:hypothetical protein